MPTISVYLSHQLQRKLRRRALETGITQRALIPQLVTQALSAPEGRGAPVESSAKTEERERAEESQADRSAEEARPVIPLGPDPEGRNAICGLCGARYKPSGITSHIRQAHPEVE